MAVQLEAALARDFILALLDLGVVELLHPAALHAEQVVVVAALVELENRLAGLEVLPREQPRVLELGEDAVDRGEADVDAFGHQRLVYILGGQMAYLARLEQLQDLAPRQRRLEPDVLQALRCAHRLSLYAHVSTTHRRSTVRAARGVRRAHSRPHALQDRRAAGKFRLAGNGVAAQARHEQRAGAPRARHAAACRRLPRRPLGLCVLAAGARRQARVAQARGVLRRRQARARRWRHRPRAGTSASAGRRAGGGGQMKVAIAGAGGRMGRTLIEAVMADRELELAVALEVAGSPAVGSEIGKTKITSDAGMVALADVLIDFTRPEGTVAHLKHARAMVIGTTGFSDGQKSLVAEAAKRIPIVMAANFAVGVNAVYKLAETAARILGEGYDVEIIEAHHRHKVDAPSGTALKLGEVVASVFKQELSSASVHGRRGETGVRPGKQIGFHAIRGGDIVGEHTVIFAGTGERVEVTVRSQSRMTYALGALRAAKWLHGRPPGLYDMSDVLGLR